MFTACGRLRFAAIRHDLFSNMLGQDAMIFRGMTQGGTPLAAAGLSVNKTSAPSRQLGVKRSFAVAWVLICGFTCGFTPALAQQAAPPAPPHWAYGTEGVVASVQPVATQAGIAALRRGGNAVDAAVATALTLGVVDNHNSGIGGGCFILIRRASGELIAIDGREAAPASATRDMYLVDGQAKTDLSQTGALASGVPGALAAYDQAVHQAGKLSLSDLLLPAAEIAEQGFEVDRVYARSLERTANQLQQFPESARVLLKADGSAYAEGEVLRQPDLARTYRAVAEQGIEWFYAGEFAQLTEQWMQEQGGLLTAQDFAAYRAKPRKPVITEYRGYQIVGFPPPSSGGVHVAQILNILEPFDLREIHRQDPSELAHVVAEAMKLAFADRAHWLGDADFADVPRGLIAKAYGQRLSRRINRQQVTAVESHGVPPNANDDFFERHTTHIAAADREGNWVAITATVNTTFGSKVIIPGTGVVMNNEMDDFSVSPGVPNAFGLVGAEANQVEPFKRPLSSMSPTLVLKEGQPVLAVGAAGGPKIITQVLLTILGYIDLKQSLPEALAAPRYHHQWSPDELLVEDTMPVGFVRELVRRGHRIRSSSSVGVTQAIAVDPDQPDQLQAAHDPRVPGQALGWSPPKP